ncbi:MAG: TetM/TetW/TetO/TetS family tetracycline resistance ribosomal protection protein [Clostridia bacterium]|nr:TetM/TetW/TetO/TetS family tetracycline resistance ribosomal protection protein [Clostridia bacterium]
MSALNFRNLGILAHVDAGKTTLTEQLLYTAGVIREAGSVDAGTTRTDSMSVERKRGISVRSATASLTWNGSTVNIIDTPGHVDFAGEVERCLEALDFAILVVSAPDGVKAHTENLLHALEVTGLPRMVFINKIDRAGADVEKVLSELRAVTGNKTVYMPVTMGADCGFEHCRIARTDFASAVTEALGEWDEAIAERFLLDDVLTEEEIAAALPDAIRETKITPVLCGCAKKGLGVTDVLDFCTRWMPDASAKATEDLSGVIFKIEHDKTMGKIAHVRLFGGTVKNRDALAVVEPVAEEKAAETDTEDAVPVEDDTVQAKDKVSQIRKHLGGRYSDAGQVEAGDIGALCGLTGAKVGRYVGSVTPVRRYALAHPLLRVRVTPDAADPDPEALPKLAAALKELSDEEPYIDAKWENGQSEIVIHLTGSVQSEILETLLAERYGLKANFSAPTVIYKETPMRKGEGYADYTMPKPCWAVVRFLFEPMPRGYGVSYHGRLPNNQCFYKYQSHIHRSFQSCLEQGIHGWEVTDFRCTLIGGEHHTIHTHPLDFFVCTPMAFLNGLVNCGSALLEPLLQMRITAPAELAGKLITEVVQGGGEYDSPQLTGDTVVLDSIVPLAKFMDFPTRLASFSSGKAVCQTNFHGYRECKPGEGCDAPRRGVDPLDRAKWILWARGAMTDKK